MRTLSVVFALLALSLVTTQSFAQTADAENADAENAALRTVIKAQRTASPVYPEVPLLSEELADVELLTDDDRAVVPILEDTILEDAIPDNQDRDSQRQARAFVARLD